jgi:hypothetical protein
MVMTTMMRGDLRTKQERKTHHEGAKVPKEHEESGDLRAEGAFRRFGV